MTGGAMTAGPESPLRSLARLARTDVIQASAYCDKVKKLVGKPVANEVVVLAVEEYERLKAIESERSGTTPRSGEKI